MQKITPFLWFDTQAEEAARFYVSIFKNSKINNVNYYTPEVAEAAGRKAGSAMTVDFELDGMKFVALNGGPMFKFTEANSYAIRCETQEEIDEKWAKLTADGGEESMCGWLKDKFGLSWQVVPAQLDKLFDGTEGGRRAIAAMLNMRKFDIAALERAYAGNQDVSMTPR